MTTAHELIQLHKEDLSNQKSRADKWWKGFLLSSLILFAFAGANLWLEFDDELGSLVLITGVVFLFLFMRKSDEARDLAAERLEFARPDLYGISVEDDGVETTRANRLASLSRDIISRKRMRMVHNRARYAEASGVILGSLAVTLLVWFAFSLEDFLRLYHGASGRSDEWLDAYELEVVSIGLIGLVFTGWAITRFRSAGSARREIERLEIEHEIMPVEEKPDAARARKLLLINQRNLSSYYAINRFNSRITIGVAILCILAGIGITIWTINEIIRADAPAETSKLVIAAVGATNAIMINIVAAIVLRIQATISSNVNAFHDRLVRSHDIFLANVIAAEIDDDGVRRDTLAAIAKTIGIRGGSGGPTKKPEATAKKEA